MVRNLIMSIALCKLNYDKIKEICRAHGRVPQAARTGFRLHAQHARARPTTSAELGNPFASQQIRKIG